MPLDCVVLHMGEHQLKDQEGAMALYLVQPTQLASRLAMFSPLRSLNPVSPRILQATVGQAVVMFMHAVVVKALAAWNTEIIRDSLHIYHEVRG